MSVTDKTYLADLIGTRIAADGGKLAREFRRRQGRGVGVAWIDDVLPDDLFAAITADPPDRSLMVRRRSLGERKFLLARTDLMPADMRACVAAFASAEVAAVVARTFDMPGLEPDAELYNGGVTIMKPGDFMRPHLDNSHSRTRRKHRRMVALYYVSKRWSVERGGELRTWRDGGGSCSDVILYRPNRLVFMEVTETSWHSVEQVRGPDDRCNLTTYYYDAVETDARVRLTRFTGWPGDPVLSACLAAQYRVRMLAERLGGRHLRPNRHVNRAL